MRVRIKASKTDPFRKGFFVHIGRGIFPLCAAQAMLAYLSIRGHAPGPLFLLQSGQPLSRTILTKWLGQYCQLLGSLGTSPATVAARHGVPDQLIQAQGRWTSNAYQVYIRTPSEALASLSHHLA